MNCSLGIALWYSGQIIVLLSLSYYASRWAKICDRPPWGFILVIEGLALSLLIPVWALMVFGSGPEHTALELSIALVGSTLSIAPVLFASRAYASAIIRLFGLKERYQLRTMARLERWLWVVLKTLFLGAMLAMACLVGAHALKYIL